MKKLKPVSKINSRCTTICKVCGKKFRYMESYLKHELRCNENALRNKKEQSKFNITKVRAVGSYHALPNSVSDSKQCKRCGRKFASDGEHDVHSRKCRHRMWHYRCLSCDTVIKLRSGIERHYLYCSGDVKPSQSFNKDLWTVLLTPKNAAAQCRSCKKLFLSTNSMRMHSLSCSGHSAHTDAYKYICKICSKEYLLRSIAEQHVRSHHENVHLRGGANLRPDDWGYYESEIVINSSTFDRATIADNLIDDYTEELNRRRLLNNHGLKVVSVFRVFMRKPTEDYAGDNKDIEVYFHTNPLVVTEGNITEDVEQVLDTVDNMIADYTTNGSGFTLINVATVINKYYVYKHLMGGRDGNTLLPKQFYTWGKIVAIEYADGVRLDENIGDQCFKHCLQLHEYKKSIGGKLKSASCSIINEKSSSGAYLYFSITDISRMVLNGYDMTHVKYPMPIKDVAFFQNCNPHIAVNIFEVEHQNIDMDDEEIDYRPKQYYINPYYSSKVQSKDVINLLYWAKSSHFYYINNLESLARLMRPFGSQKPSKYSKLCHNCLQFIDNRYITMENHKKCCFERKHQQESYAVPGEMIEFKRYRLMNKLGIFVVADFEASNIVIHQPPLVDMKFKGMSRNFSKIINQTVYKNLCDEAEYPYHTTKSTRHTSLHRVNSVGYILHVPDTYVDFPHDKIEAIGGLTGTFYAKGDTIKHEEYVIDLFMNWLRECSKIVESYLMQQNEENVQRVQLEQLHADPYIAYLKKETKECRYCQEVFVNEEDKVLDHCHYDLSFRSWVHQKCNLKAKSRKYNEFQLNIFFHNFQGYDSCPILMHAKPKDDEVWECRMRGNKVQMAKCKNLIFRDSYQLLPLSLEAIGKDLPPNTCTYQAKLLNTSTYGKSIYPYEWMTSVSKFSETDFPKREDFQSSLSGPVSEGDYNRAKEFYTTHCNTFKDFHHHYLLRDCALLADALLHWQHLTFANFTIDLLQCESLPSASKECMLQLTREKLELITDPVMYSYFVNNIRGGLTISAKRYAKILPETESTQQIKYFDFKSLYADTEKKDLPVGNFSYIDPVPTVSELHNLVATHSCDSDIGFLCIVNTHVPHRLHWLLSDLPPIAKKISVEPEFYPSHSEWSKRSRSKVKKLTAHLFDTEDYGISLETVRFLLTLGVEITKVSCVIRFTRKPFIRPYIEILQKLRHKSQQKESIDNTMNILTKLFANSFFGKLIENPYNYEQSTFVFTRQKFEKRLQSNRFKSANFYSHGAMVKSKAKSVKFDKPVYAGMFILDYSKLHLLSTYYNRILPAYISCASNPFSYDTRLRLIYLDTDCLVLHLHLNKEQELRFYSLLHSIFDFSNLNTDHILYSTNNSEMIGVLKDEVEGRIINEFVTSGAKAYALTFKDTSGIPKEQQSVEVQKQFAPIVKIKAVPKCAQTQITTKDFLKVFNNSNERHVVYYNAIRIGKARQLYLMSCQRKTLNPHDSKRYVLRGSTDSLALGHYCTLQKTS